MTIAHDVRGSGPAVLLVHEGVADRRMWRHQIPVLEPNHTVVAVDLRGFGETPHASGPFSHVEDLREVLDELGIERAAVVGGSLGGRVALELALAHPDRVSRLVLCPPALPNWEWSPVVKAAWQAESDAYEAGDLDRATEVNVELWLVRTMQRHAFELPEPDPFGPETKLDPPTSRRLGEVGVPTLLVVGDEDVPDFGAIAERLSRELPDARLVVIHDAAHVVALERPEEFNPVLVEFLAVDFS